MEVGCPLGWLQKYAACSRAKLAKSAFCVYSTDYFLDYNVEEKICAID